MKSIVLVGELNPYGNDPEYALYPHPPNSAGARLHAILDMSLGEYIKTARYNLCTGRWSAPRARDKANWIREEHRDDVIVLLGRKVASAFDVAKYIPVFGSSSEFGPTMVALPHPSGRCRIWNEPNSADRAREVVRLARGMS